MIGKPDIKKIIRSALRRSRGLRDHHLMHPIREWFGGLAAAALLLLMGAGWSVYQYVEYNAIKPSTSAESDAPTTIYQKPAVESALKELEARTARLEEQRLILEAGRSTLPPPPTTPDIPSDVSTSTDTPAPAPEATDTLETPPQEDVLEVF